MVKGFKKNNVKGLKQKIAKAKKLKEKKLRLKEINKEKEELSKDKKTNPKSKFSKPLKKIAEKRKEPKVVIIPNSIYDRYEKKYVPLYKKYKYVKGKRIDPLINKRWKENINRYAVPKGFYLYHDKNKKDSFEFKTVKDNKDNIKKNLKNIKFNNNELYNFNSGSLVNRDTYKANKNYKKSIANKQTLVPNNTFKATGFGKAGGEYDNPKKASKNALIYGNIFNYVWDEEFKNNDINDKLQEFIEAIKYSFNNGFSNKLKSFKNKKLRLSFGSKKDTRDFPLDDIDNLGEYISGYLTGMDSEGNELNWSGAGDIDGQQFGSDNGDAKVLVSLENLDMTWARITIIDTMDFIDDASVGGNYAVSSKYWYCNQPITTDNLCLEGAIKRHLGLKKQLRTYRKDITELTNGRIKLGDKVSLDDLKIYEDYFKVNINIYLDEPHYNNDNCLILSKNKYDDFVNILYKEEHANLIIKKKLKINELSTEVRKELGVYKKPKNKILESLTKKEEKKRKEIAVFFDIETVFDKHNYNYLQTYGVSWVVWDLEKEFIYDPSIHTKEPYCYYEKGKGCLEKLIRFLINSPLDCVYRPIGFNNSRFDNYALCDKASQMGLLNNVFMADGSILYCQIENTRNAWDASRFLTGQSLKKACESFKTNPKKASDLIDHYTIQTYYEKYNMDGLCNLLEKNEDLVLYNKIDCLCLLDLTVKMRNAYKITFNKDILDYLTISSLGYAIQVEKWAGKVDKEQLILQDESLTLPQQVEKISLLKDKYYIHKPLNYKDDKFFRDSLTAGRTQSFYGAKDYKGKVAMVDVKSLYPTVMGNYGGNVCPYPMGRYYETNEYQEGMLGIYRVNIKHQKCKWKGKEKILKNFKVVKELTGIDLYKEYAPNVIARREKDKPLDWFYKGEIKDVSLTSVDIEVIKWATEDKDCIEVLNGYYWKDSSTTLFKDFLDPPKKEKTRQDKLKKNNDPTYNVAVREVNKGISNALSGKLLECLHEDICKEFSVKEWYKMSKDEKVKEMEIVDYGGGLSFITAKKSKEDVFDELKSNKKKPSYLGMFVYSYARKLMYQELLSKYICLYMDTDSACMPLLEYDRLNNENGFELMENGEYGCLEEEVCEVIKCKKCEDREKRLDDTGCSKEEVEFRNNNPMVDGIRCKDCKINVADRLIAISPKNYAVINSINENFSKRKFKGVRKTDYFLPLSYFGSYKKEVRITKSGREEKFLTGKAIDKIRGVKENKLLGRVFQAPMDEETIRAYREHNVCDKCIDSVIGKKNKCGRCKAMEKKMCKAYSTEMFELLCAGKKIAVFCSMINRIKYSIGRDTEWEYAEQTQHTPTVEELNEIFKSSSKSKEPIRLMYNKEDKDINSQRKLETIFKLKQKYLIKII